MVFNLLGLINNEISTYYNIAKKSSNFVYASKLALKNKLQAVCRQACK